MRFCSRWLFCIAISVLTLLGLLQLYNTFHRDLSECELQGRSGVDATIMFGQSRDRVLASYEDRLPRADNITALDGVWQNVSGTRSKFFVYSAYYERRVEKVRSIRVIGATTTRDSEPVWCRLWYNTEKSQSVSVLAQIKIIRESWKLRYSACFVLCPLGVGMIVPYSVSIVRYLHSPPANHLLVIDNYQKQHLAQQSNPGKLALCVKPMYNFNETLRLIEFLELNLILGVEHFTLYNHTVSASSSCILKHYIDLGLVTLLPWQLDLVSVVEIRTEGIFASLNDCLYRNMYRYKTIAVIDLDEFIIPREALSLVQLIETIDNTSKIPKAYGAYIFRNAFFFQQRPDDPSINSTFQAQLLTISKTSRNVHLNSYNQRSKYICKPDLVVELGNHFVWEFMPGVLARYVKPTSALNQHYRTCEGGCDTSETMIDRTAHRFKDRLATNVLEKWNFVKMQCDLK